MTTKIIKEFIDTDSSNRKREFIEFLCDECSCSHIKQKRWIKQNGNFCSVTCSAKNKSKKCRTEVNCSFCQNFFSKRKNSFTNSKSGLFFCSRSCKDEGQKLINNIKGVWPAHYGTGDGFYDYRKIAFDFYESKCYDCGYNEYKELLQVHHKDLNRRNNSVENLQILCPNCHMKVHYLTNTGLFSKK